MIEYLWIDDYKNIKKKDFNFSNKYNFIFNEQEMQLDKTALKTFHLFGEKISNITGVVGENGSGKTNILDFLSSISTEWYTNIKKKFIVIFDDKIIYYLGESIKLKSKTIKESNFIPFEYTDLKEMNANNKYKYHIDGINKIFKDKGIDYNYSTIFYSDEIHNYYRETSYLNKNYDRYFNISSNYLLQYNTIEEKQIEEYMIGEATRTILFFKDNYKTFDLFNLPKKLYIKLNTNILNRKFGLISSYDKQVPLSEFDGILKEINVYKNQEKEKLSNSDKYKVELLQSLLSIFILNTSSYKYKDSSHMISFSVSMAKEVLKKDGNIIENLLRVLDEFNEGYNEILIKLLEVEKIHEKYNKEYKEIKDIITDHEKSKVQEWNELGFSQIDNKLSSFESVVGKKNIVEKACKQLEKIRNFVNDFFDHIDKSLINNSIVFDFESQESSFNIDYFKYFINAYTDIFPDHYKFPIFLYDFDIILSSGQQKILTFFSRLYYLICEEKKVTKGNILILIDEPDSYLHPEWQRLLLDYFIKFINDLYKNENAKIQIILTSHSPFVVSDLPKENIIMLGDKIRDLKNTFGSNIHTLLSNEFFMKSTIGAFAKSKIDEVLDILNRGDVKEINEKEDYINYIISIIGEPIIKNKLRKMLSEKLVPHLPDDKEREIEILKERILKLEQFNASQSRVDNE